ncbi:hypothetical protein ABZO31_25805 [Streptomyces sp. HUAS MG47]|uniref:hypothetical protein n=1 Tax=Streptomyces solicamelliae TaxID=3231716 RepID=UPI003878216A
MAANVVAWRRWGDFGQELRPGTKAFKGGAKVYVIGTYPGFGDEQLEAVGRGRHHGRWISIKMPTRHLHTFRAKLVHAPAVLRRYDWHPVEREAAERQAERLHRIAREQRQTYHGGPHPDPCLCHACLTGEASG